MNRSFVWVVMGLSVTLFFAVASTMASDWTRFRGDGGAGVADGVPAPLEMSPDGGYAWKRTVLPGKSSPVLSGDRLFLTAYQDDRLITIAFDRDTGETLWTKEVQRAHLDDRHPNNDAAAPTPVTDGRSLYVFFADFGLVAYTVEGRELWRRPMGPFTGPRGIAASPLLIEGMLVLMIEQRKDGAVLGFDAESGELIWKVPRPTVLGGSFATPVSYRTAAGDEHAVVVSPFELAGYDPKTGEKLWRVGGLPHQPKSSPLVVGDVILVGVQGDSARGRLKSWEQMFSSLDKDGSGVVEEAEIQGTVADYDGDGVFGRADYDQWFVEKSPASLLMAVRPNGLGDLTAKAVLWSVDRGVPRVTTPVAYDGVVYLARNGGILSSIDLETGAVLKEGRLRDAIDEYFASPVATDGKILTSSRDCKLTWIKAAREWEILRVNDLLEECFATPALGHDGVFVRTTTALYRFAVSE
jgi:outer membrane protein assembly factor BamB